MGDEELGEEEMRELEEDPEANMDVVVEEHTNAHAGVSYSPAEPEPTIDEQSPDEDDRIAEANLRWPPKESCKLHK